jgi:FkbM family methyltransferase
LGLKEAVQHAVVSHPKWAARAFSQVDRLGLHINPGHHPLRQLIALAGITHILDVGANNGGFGQRIRIIGYEGRITSFEPVQSAFSELKQRAARDPNWRVAKLALGDRDTEDVVHVSRATWLSSLLPPSEWLTERFPEVTWQQDEQVTVRRLDSIADEYLRPDDATLLKIDTQGYEQKVLDGATASIARIKGVYLELSYGRPLYEGEPLSFEVISYLHQRGFTLVHLEPLHYHLEDGQVLQGDGLFLRLEQ